jgi:hypothetical protein
MKEAIPPAAPPARANDEFFVGWLPMPSSYARFLLPIGILLPLVGVGIAVVAARQQQSPGSGIWESDTSRTFEGVAYASPYAVIRVPGEKPGDPVRTILLVEGGKFGAVERVLPWDGQPVRVSGLLLHREERWMLELASGETGIQPVPAMPLEVQTTLRRPSPQSLGILTLAGEIIDSKCYLGAMKPGGGKTHKACAALCLAGGVPAMFVTRDGEKCETFYLLASPEGGQIEPGVIDFVGDSVEITGHLERQGDLQVLKIAADQIRRR